MKHPNPVPPAHLQQRFFGDLGAVAEWAESRIEETGNTLMKPIRFLHQRHAITVQIAQVASSARGHEIGTNQTMRQQFGNPLTIARNDRAS
jgi:hypothetical protein